MSLRELFGLGMLFLAKEGLCKFIIFAIGASEVFCIEEVVIDICLFLAFYIEGGWK
jgi:hypothetical protein